MNAISIPLSAQRRDIFTPPVLVGDEREARFTFLVPTPSERDTLGTRLFEAGLQPITQELIRATMIDELYYLDWSHQAPPGKIETEEDRIAFNELRAEEIAEKLENYWLRMQVQDEANERWKEQEGQRLLDEAGGAPPEPPAEMPTKLITIREQSWVTILMDDITMRSDRIRKLGAKQIAYGKENAQTMVRIHLLDVDPLHREHWPVDLLTLHRDRHGFVPIEYLDRLRDHIGRAAWQEIVGRVDGHYSLPETERKNSDSPPGNQSDQTGSQSPSGGSATSDGTWTGSGIEPVPTAESETITDRSSSSSSELEDPKPKSGQTGEG